jgi:hypothetical protein
MHNTLRGEIEAELDGRTFRLCLTLGALAELESAVGAADLPGLAERLDKAQISARDIILIIACGLRGAGHEISDADVAQMKVSEGLSGYVNIAARLLAATFGNLPENPPSPQDA